MSLQWFETQDEPGKRLLWLQSMARASSFIQSSPLRTSQTGDTMTGFFLYLGSYLSVNSVMSEAKKKRLCCCTLCVRLQLKAHTHWLYVQSWASEQPWDLFPRVGWRAHLRVRSGSGSAIRALITLWPHREVRAWALAFRLTHVPTHCERRERGHSGVPLLEIETSPPLMCARTRRKKGERN